jgi:thioester reductase-like protein
MVNAMLDYRELEKANVSGTKEVIRLACRLDPKPLHFVSTMSVLKSNWSRALEHEWDDSCGLTGGYPQSKWVAEKLVRSARSRGLPVAIYRPGRISGDSKNGAGNRKDLGSLFMKACIEIGLAPVNDADSAAFDNFLPVDYASKAIVSLAKNKWVFERDSIHLLNPTALDWRDVFRALRKHGYHLESVSYGEWYRGLARFVQTHEATVLHPLVDLFAQPPLPSGRDAVGNESGEVRSPCQGTFNMLAALNGECPRVTEDLLAMYFDYFKECEFFPEAPCSCWS